MAITDAGKLFETTSLQKEHLITLGATPCKAGSVVVIFISAEASGSIGVSSVVDSKGNTWEIEQNPGGTMVAMVWSRLSVPLVSLNTITITLSKVPSSCWKSGHNFEGADSVPIDVQTGSGTSTQAYTTVAVTGSDWLALGMAFFPSDAQMTTTEVDSSTSQDDSGSAEPYAECWSFNGTTGTSTRIGATIATAKYRKVIGISLPFRALNTAKALPGMFMGI